MTFELTADLTMETLLERYPGARRALFSAFHIGGCQSCAYQPEQTLAEVCRHHGIDLAEALTCLADSRDHDQRMLISPSELQSLRQGEAPLILLDTRTREEFDAITLPGAQLMTQEVQTALFADQDKVTQKIVLFDHQGRSVLDHCAWFRGHGLNETYGLEGGIDRFAQEVDPNIPRYRLELD
jgi:rhodanese-related sulfurtransferase